MNKYFKNPYGGVEIPDFSTPDLSKYRFISTSAIDGNRTYRRETPKPVPKKQIRVFAQGVNRACNRKTYVYPIDYDYNVLNKYSRRKFRRMSAAIYSSARSNFLASAAQYKD
jgi:hypothetical protein